ncbi:MAG TPA: orotate phosphoribosyltransferase, partial [Thermoanaerobaculia bacterium]|nr:orotate phosphoribosyltransferase [Thermoanaerobaculia bacterium]
MPADIRALLEETGALLTGHFRLSSGLHSPNYVQCARLLEHPRNAKALGEALAKRIEDLAKRIEKLDKIVAPALGGVIIGYTVAEALGVPFVFTERKDGAMTLRRGFRLNDGERVVIVEDVVTTGKSTRETIAVAEAAGATVVGAAGIINRGGDEDLGVPFTALATVSFPTW